MIEFPCAQCGRVFKVREELAGKRGKCPQCGTVRRIPVPVVVPADDGDGAIGPGPSPLSDSGIDLSSDPGLVPVDDDDATGDALSATDDVPQAPIPPDVLSDLATPPDASPCQFDRAGIEQAGMAAIQAAEPIRVAQVSYNLPPEPAYYGMLEGFGKLCFVLSVMAGLIGFMVMLAGINPGAESSAGYVGLGIILSAVPLCLTAAVNLLGVDVARNIRAIRYHQH
jgi:hypothetical protein